MIDQDTFEGIIQRDVPYLEGRSWLTDWLFADRQIKRGVNVDMNFHGFEGPTHLEKYFRYLKGYTFPDYFGGSRFDELAAMSVRRDSAVRDTLGLRIPEVSIANVGRYNAQDAILRNFYPVPERQEPRRILDFGAGHGRQANLLFTPVDAHPDQFLVSVDGIAASYLTQSLYYQALGLRVGEYMTGSPDVTFDQLADGNQVVHLPTWRMDMIPDESLDMVMTVQVLRELGRPLFLFAISQFRRVLKPGGALYIRDRAYSHNPNGLDQDEVVRSHGFILEFRPHVKDMIDLHGRPTIWRKPDQDVWLETP
jgi:SAM-dependent methyltransferase